MITKVTALDRIKRHMEWSSDLRAGLVPRRRVEYRRRRVEEPKVPRKMISLTERGHRMSVYARATLSTLEHKVTFDELLIFLITKEEMRRKYTLPATTLKAIDDFLNWSKP